MTVKRCCFSPIPDVRSAWFANLERFASPLDIQQTATIKGATYTETECLHFIFIFSCRFHFHLLACLLGCCLRNATLSIQLSRLDWLFLLICQGEVRSPIVIVITGGWTERGRPLFQPRPKHNKSLLAGMAASEVKADGRRSSSLSSRTYSYISSHSPSPPPHQSRPRRTLFLENRPLSPLHRRIAIRLRPVLFPGDPEHVVAPDQFHPSRQLPVSKLMKKGAKSRSHRPSSLDTRGPRTKGTRLKGSKKRSISLTESTPVPTSPYSSHSPTPPPR